MTAKSEVKVSQSCLALCNPIDGSLPGSSVHGNSSGKNTGVGCHVFLQRIFPTQGLNPGLLHCSKILYHLSHQGSLRILESVAYPFSRGSSWPGVFCIAGEFFTSWATREAQKTMINLEFHTTRKIISSRRVDGDENVDIGENTNALELTHQSC